MTVDPATRRANARLLLALVLFAVGLCAVILLWMRHVTVRNGGTVYPPPAETSYFSAGQNFHRLS